jgi:hypothetical protein
MWIRAGGASKHLMNQFPQLKLFMNVVALNIVEYANKKDRINQYSAEHVYTCSHKNAFFIIYHKKKQMKINTLITSKRSRKQ